MLKDDLARFLICTIESKPLLEPLIDAAMIRSDADLTFKALRRNIVTISNKQRESISKKVVLVDYMRQSPISRRILVPETSVNTQAKTDEVNFDRSQTQMF